MMLPLRKIGFLSGALLLGAAACGFAQDAAPGLQWEETTLKIETQGDREPQNVTFRFRNAGDRPVNILSATASCGCTVPATEKKTYAPGESGTLPVAHKPKPGPGVHAYQINVQTDEGGGRSHVLVLQVTNNPRVAVMPRVLNWAAGEERAPKRVSVLLRPGEPLKLTGAQAERDVLDFKVEDGAQPAMKNLVVVPKPGTVFVPGRVRVRLLTEPPLPPSMDNQFFVILR